MSNFCLFCKKQSVGNFFKAWDSTNYFFCIKCGCSSALDNNDLTYEESYWSEIIDPDGNKRNLLNEKEFKIKNWYGNVINFINQKSMPNSKVLDIGAGLGHLISSLRSDIKKYAIDVSNYSINFINENYPEIETKCGKFNYDEYENEFFDIIVTYHVIEHLNDPHTFLENLKQKLKKNGILIIGTPNGTSLAAKIFKGNFRLYSKGHLIIFSKKSLIKLLISYNFEIIKTEFPYFKTNYFNFRNILRMFFYKEISPPFYGSIMTAYARKI